METIKIKSGRTTVTVTGPSAAELEAIVRGLLGPAIDVAEAEVGKVLQELQKTWPVRSGKSLESWKPYILVDPDKESVSVGLTSDLVYVRYIKSGKQGKKQAVRSRSPLQTEVNQPMKALKKELAAKLREVLVPHLAKGVTNG